MRNIYALLFILMLPVCSCKNQSHKREYINTPKEFNRNILNSDLKSLAGTNGQLLYLPVYSNIPYQIDTGLFDMSAFVAIHNTDLNNSITLSQVMYFNQDGRLVDDFLKGSNVEISPLATKNFYIPYEDKSGTGANFLIEWVSDSIVNEPLIESVTLCLKPNNTLAISSKGKVIRQNK
ncbi:MAG TPA: DUF3124 domain-containing protein [Bacteroidales bacterium]|nr:DUF3124 domain-containing protein [Bacteroidales bacterium]